MAQATEAPGTGPRSAYLEARRPHRIDEPPIAVEVLHLTSTAVRVAFGGELCMASASQARHVLAAAAKVGCRQVEVDLSAVSFCDTSGLRVLLDAQRECAERGGLLLLTDPSPRVLRILDLTGLTQQLVDGRT